MRFRTLKIARVALLTKALEILIAGDKSEDRFICWCIAKADVGTFGKDDTLSTVQLNLSRVGRELTQYIEQLVTQQHPTLIMAISNHIGDVIQEEESKNMRKFLLELMISGKYPKDIADFYTKYTKRKK